ncbi:hypothetical protein VIBNIFTn2_880021 [Vibrio nigripulchritudo FTn2]|nr:hypothetical protein VIBNIAM115_1930006 [Vibrio nigripulchritudo AM115]CCN44691.1 hypothetical protein VIBNIFTn2_880021 [Vibrio nigripulchritudo FTn2]
MILPRKDQKTTKIIGLVSQFYWSDLDAILGFYIGEIELIFI